MAKKDLEENVEIISTDDDKIAENALQNGAEVPFKRPAHLSSDDASSKDALQHAVSWIEIVTDGGRSVW